jgi:secreted trypsin-like serine protease
VADQAIESEMLGYLSTSTISGWGTTGDGGTSSDRLRYATVPVIPQTRCQATYDALAEDHQTITTAMICAGGGRSDACYGDSGSPLMMRTRDKALHLEGITSIGAECHASSPSKLPGVYTRVPAFASWIRCSQGRGSAC